MTPIILPFKIKLEYESDLDFRVVVVAVSVIPESNVNTAPGAIVTL